MTSFHYSNGDYSGNASVRCVVVDSHCVAVRDVLEEVTGIRGVEHHHCCHHHVMGAIGVCRTGLVVLLERAVIVSGGNAAVIGLDVDPVRPRLCCRILGSPVVVGVADTARVGSLVHIVHSSVSVDHRVVVESDHERGRIGCRSEVSWSVVSSTYLVCVLRVEQVAAASRVGLEHL